jgi:hypothetical protein
VLDCSCQRHLRAALPAPAVPPSPMERAASVISSLLGGGGGSGAQAATVKSVLVYPIKSCRGISVPQAPITATGTSPLLAAPVPLAAPSTLPRSKRCVFPSLAVKSKILSSRVQVGSPVDARQLQRESMHPEGGAQACSG